MLLRQDNADRRLANYGKEFGLIAIEFAENVSARERVIEEGIKTCETIKIHARDVNKFLQSKGSSEIESAETIAKLCKRPELKLRELLNLNGFDGNSFLHQLVSDEMALQQVEIELKYEGYISRQYENVARLEKYEGATIPLTLNYSTLNAISAEGREKLSRIKPRSIGQASRISGVTPSDISILLVYLKR